MSGEEEPRAEGEDEPDVVLAWHTYASLLRHLDTMREMDDKAKLTDCEIITRYRKLMALLRHILFLAKAESVYMIQVFLPIIPEGAESRRYLHDLTLEPY